MSKFVSKMMAMLPKMLYDPRTGEPYGKAADLYRETFPNAVWKFNPWTGLERDASVVRSDPHGYELQDKPELHTLPETMDALLKLIEGSYSWALLMMERGKRVRMQEWRVKGTWVMLVRGAVLMPRDHPFSEVRRLAMGRKRQESVQNTFVYYTKDGNFHYGWVATHCVMLAKTWEIVPDDE